MVRYAAVGVIIDGQQVGEDTLKIMYHTARHALYVNGVMLMDEIPNEKCLYNLSINIHGEDDQVTVTSYQCF